MEQFFGMQMLMGIIKLPKYHMYQENATRYSKIADAADDAA